MKKYIIGGIIGAFIMISGQVAAEELSRIGKVIQGEADVIKGDQELSKAIIVDGKSYAPVRDIVESFGSTATYEKGVITIENSEVNSSTTIGLTEEEIVIRGKKNKIEREMKPLQSKIESINTGDETLRAMIDEQKKWNPDNAEAIEANFQIEMKKRNDLKSELQAELDAKQAQLDEINKQIATLESSQ